MGGVMGYSPRTCLSPLLSPARGATLAGENTPVQPTPEAKNLTLPGCPSLLYQSHDTGLTQSLTFRNISTVPALKFKLRFTFSFHSHSIIL
jgi:hypothetical protein